VAFGEAGATPRAWSVDLGKRLGDRERFSKTISLTRWACKRFKPDLIAIEAPIGGKTTRTSSWACGPVPWGKRRGFTCLSRSATSPLCASTFFGKHLTAKHFPHLPAAKAKAEIKRSVMNRCKALGWEVDDHDAADAAAIWDYACAVHAKTGHETTPLFSGAQHG
jgi:hypothetical protein